MSRYSRREFSRATIKLVNRKWLRRVLADIEVLDRATKGARGPARDFSFRVLFVGIVCLYMDGHAPHIRRLADQFANAEKRTLRMFGVEEAPTARQLYWLMEVARRYQQEGNPSARLQWLLNILIRPSVPDGHADADVVAMDTMLLPAYCKKVSKAHVEKHGASDPDATWKSLSTGNPDDDSGDEPDPGTPSRRRGATEKGGAKKRPHKKSVLGYGAVNVSSESGPEYILAAAFGTANKGDVELGTRLLIEFTGKSGLRPRVLEDRGYSQEKAPLAALRQAGLPVTFDLKSTELGLSNIINGYLVIDGWLFAPCLPRRLWVLPRPGKNASEAVWDQWLADMKERGLYAVVPNGTADTAEGIYVDSPAVRGRIRCPQVPESMHNPDTRVPVCTGEHAPDQGCAKRHMMFKAAEHANGTYQFPRWGTAEWARLYNLRTGVERANSRMKSDAWVGFRAGRFCFKGIGKVGLLYGLAVVAHNLLLEESVEDRAGPPVEAAAMAEAA